MALHQSEVIAYTQADDQLRLRVRALIAQQNVADQHQPSPENQLTEIMWEVAVDPVVLTYLGTPEDQDALRAKIAAAGDAPLLDVIRRALTTGVGS